MLDILIYTLCYIGAAYIYMAVPCFIWYKYGEPSFENTLLPFGLFVLAPLSWPLATFGWLAGAWGWLCSGVRKLIWDAD